MENILKKEIIYFIYFLKKLTGKLDFNPSILCPIVNKYLIEGRMITSSKIGVKMTFWVSGNSEILHSYNDHPSMDYDNGTKRWYKNGKLHRDGDKPALIYTGGKIWYKNGKFHRDNNRPAIVYENGIKEWYINGNFIC